MRLFVIEHKIECNRTDAGRSISFSALAKVLLAMGPSIYAHYYATRIRTSETVCFLRLQVSIGSTGHMLQRYLYHCSFFVLEWVSASRHSSTSLFHVRNRYGFAYGCQGVAYRHHRKKNSYIYRIPTANSRDGKVSRDTGYIPHKTIGRNQTFASSSSLSLRWLSDVAFRPVSILVSRLFPLRGQSCGVDSAHRLR